MALLNDEDLAHVADEDVKELTAKLAWACVRGFK